MLVLAVMLVVIVLEETITQGTALAVTADLYTLVGIKPEKCHRDETSRKVRVKRVNPAN